MVQLLSPGLKVHEPAAKCDEGDEPPPQDPQISRITALSPIAPAKRAGLRGLPGWDFRKFISRCWRFSSALGCGKIDTPEQQVLCFLERQVVKLRGML